MRITVLGSGTSQGVPVIACQCSVCTSADPKDKRLRSSVLVEAQGCCIVIDTGPDFRQQMLRENVGHLDAVLLTHGHKDHIGGLDDVRAYNFFQRMPMDVFASFEVHEALKKEFSYAFAKERYPGVPEIRLHPINKNPFRVGPLDVTPIEVLHFHLPVLGFRLDDFVYITDASSISDEESEKIRNSKILIINGLRKQSHYSHFNLGQALEVIKTARPERAYITHISHMMGLHESVEKELPPNVFLAYDGMKLDI